MRSPECSSSSSARTIGIAFAASPAKLARRRACHLMLTNARRSHLQSPLTRNHRNVTHRAEPPPLPPRVRLTMHARLLDRRRGHRGGGTDRPCITRRPFEKPLSTTAHARDTARLQTGAISSIFFFYKTGSEAAESFFMQIRTARGSRSK